MNEQICFELMIWALHEKDAEKKARIWKVMDRIWERGNNA